MNLLRIFLIGSLASLCAALLSCNHNDRHSGEADGSGHHAETTHHEETDHSGHSANAHMHKSPFDTLVARFEDPRRNEWQQVEKVVTAMGNLQGKTVADIGAGTGFFSFPLAEAGARVIAIDIDQRFLDYIAEKNRQRSAPADIEIRLAKEDNPMLLPDEADRVIIVDTWHHIDGRVEYFSGVRGKLRDGGELWVVDFRKEELPVGPPAKMKLSAEQVAQEMRDAGYQNIRIDMEMLPYQYIVVGDR